MMARHRIVNSMPKEIMPSAQDVAMIDTEE